jgi:hypothetical protein
VRRSQGSLLLGALGVLGEDKKKPYYLPPASASLSAGFSYPYGSPASMQVSPSVLLLLPGSTTALGLQASAAGPPGAQGPPGPMGAGYNPMAGTANAFSVSPGSYYNNFRFRSKRPEEAPEMHTANEMAVDGVAQGILPSAYSKAQRAFVEKQRAAK